MGGRGGSFSGSRSRGTKGASFKTVHDAMTALNREGLFDQYVSLVQYDFNDPNDVTGTPMVDVQTANAIYDIVHQIATEFPELKGIARCLSPEDMGTGTYAHCHFYSGEVNFNPKYFKDWAKLSASCENDVKSGWSPAGTENPKSIIAHEFGHAIDGYLTYKKQAFGYTASGNFKVASAAMRPSVMKAAGLKVSDVGSSVSRYATTNSKEWFAESFAEYVCSPNPRPAAAEFGKQLRAILKQVS